MNNIIIFIKNPVLGKVKTRLATTLGDQKALEIYQRLLDVTRKTVTKVNAKYHLFYSDVIDMDDDWDIQDFDKYLQQGNDLGERMSAAFRNIFSQNDGSVLQKVVIIGSDCSALTPDILEMAFTILGDSDVVVGPTFDGGYYLLGMKEYQPALFENITWSTDAVYQETNDKARLLQLNIADLPTLSDIDNEADWNKALLENPDLSH
ncbi:MAG TPA: TIGR04282 family arsenosugar biosynthesis glycosyltransferase [Saprospiraceae bacterium]|nr:TIGR04282 family arsenosugar biosynthesis glycosyltransferase [Saprospiraceae bacterium]